MKCEICQGRGFTELEHGLIMVECEICKGEGLDDAKSRYFDMISTPKIAGVEAPDDSNSGTRQPNTSIRGRNPGESQQPEKRKAKKKARRRTG